MRDEKQYISDSINKNFRKYEKVYNKVFKKGFSRSEFSQTKKINPKYTSSLQIFQNLNKAICKHNPNNSISLIKLWRYNEKLNESVYRSIVEEKKKYSEAMNKQVNAILLECNSKLFVNKNRYILSSGFSESGYPVLGRVYC